MSKILIFILIGLVIVLIGGGSYLIFQNQRLISQLVKQSSSSSPSPALASSPSSQAQSLPASSPSPSPKLSLADLQTNIEAAINSKNFAALEAYMTKPKVNFIIMSSSCCEPKTTQEAVDSLSYINEGIPFDFNQNTTLVKTLKSKNDRLTNAYIGLSKTKEHLVAFTINDKNQISQAEVSISYKLYNQ